MEYITYGRGTTWTHHKTIKQWTKPRKSYTPPPGLCRDDPLATVRLPQRSLFSQSLGKYWQLNQNNQKTEHIPT